MYAYSENPRQPLHYYDHVEHSIRSTVQYLFFLSECAHRHDFTLTFVDLALPQRVSPCCHKSRPGDLPNRVFCQKRAITWWSDVAQKGKRHRFVAPPWWFYCCRKRPKNRNVPCQKKRVSTSDQGKNFKARVTFCCIIYEPYFPENFTYIFSGRRGIISWFNIYTSSVFCSWLLSL